MDKKTTSSCPDGNHQGNHSFCVYCKRAGFNAMVMNMYIFTWCVYGSSQAFNVEKKYWKWCKYNSVPTCLNENLWLVIDAIFSHNTQTHAHTNTHTHTTRLSLRLFLSKSSLFFFLGKFKSEDHSSLNPRNWLCFMSSQAETHCKSNAAVFGRNLLSSLIHPVPSVSN